MELHVFVNLVTKDRNICPNQKTFIYETINQINNLGLIDKQ